MLVWNSCFKIVEKVIVIETYFSLELVFFDESGLPLERVARVDCHPSILGNGWQPPVNFQACFCKVSDFVIIRHKISLIDNDATR